MSFNPPWNDDPATLNNWDKWCKFELNEGCYACENAQGAGKHCKQQCIAAGCIDDPNKQGGIGYTHPPPPPPPSPASSDSTIDSSPVKATEYTPVFEASSDAESNPADVESSPADVKSSPADVEQDAEEVVVEKSNAGVESSIIEGIDDSSLFAVGVVGLLLMTMS